MLAEGALPCDTVAPPSFTVTYQLPPLSPLRLNWMVAFMPLAASAFTLADICSKISFGVIVETPPIWGGGVGEPWLRRPAVAPCQESNKPSIPRPGWVRSRGRAGRAARWPAREPGRRPRA